MWDLFSKSVGVQGFTFLLGNYCHQRIPRVGWDHIILLLIILKKMRMLANCISYFLECMENILPSNFFRITAKLLVTWISPIYLKDRVIFLFLVLLKEIWLMDEYKILSFLVLVLREWGRAVSSRFLCVTSGLENFSWEVMQVVWYNLLCLGCLYVIKQGLGFFVLLRVDATLGDVCRNWEHLHSLKVGKYLQGYCKTLWMYIQNLKKTVISGCSPGAITVSSQPKFWQQIPGNDNFYLSFYHVFARNQEG